MSGNRALLERAPEHLKLIGLIAVHSAHLDRAIWRLLALLTDLDAAAARELLPEPTSNLRADIVINVARRRGLDPEDLAQLNGCLGHIKRCNRRRDELRDSAYGIGRNGLMRTSASDECDEIVPVTREQLQRLADDLAACAADLDRVISSIRLDAGFQTDSRAGKSSDLASAT